MDGSFQFLHMYNSLPLGYYSFEYFIFVPSVHVKQPLLFMLIINNSLVTIVVKGLLSGSEERGKYIINHREDTRNVSRWYG